MNLIEATQAGDINSVKHLLDNDNNHCFDTSHDEKGYTEFHWAAYFDEVAILELLLSNKPSKGIQLSNRKMSCLHIAVLNNSIGSIKSLLESKIGSNIVNLKNCWGETALHLASSIGKKTFKKSFYFSRIQQIKYFKI